MDKLDVEILKVLLVNNGVPPGTPILRRSFRSIARELGVDEGTVRNRMKRLRVEGILRGWYLGMSPGLNGSGIVFAWFSVDPSLKASIIRRLLSLPRIERVCDYLGPKLSAVIFVDREEEPASALKEVLDAAGSEPALLSSTSLPVPSISLKQTDAAIVKVLRKDPLASYSSASKILKLSERTIRRRVAKLTEDGTVYALPVVDLKAIQGTIPVELVVDYSSAESRTPVNSLIARKLEEDLMFYRPSGESGYFAVMCRNVSAAEELVKWVMQQPGVKGARASILLDVVLNAEHYLERKASSPS